MKPSSLHIKLILLTLLAALALPARAELTALTDRVTWYFGYELPDGVTADDNNILWSDYGAENSTTTDNIIGERNGLSIESRIKSPIYNNTPAYLYDRKSLKFKFVVSCDGFINVKATYTNSNSDYAEQIGGSSKPLNYKIGDDDVIYESEKPINVKQGSLNVANSNLETIKIPISGITDNTEITIYSDGGVIDWYSISWTPADAISTFEGGTESLSGLTWINTDTREEMKYSNSDVGINANGDKLKFISSDNYLWLNSLKSGDRLLSNGVYLGGTGSFVMMKVEGPGEITAAVMNFTEDRKLGIYVIDASQYTKTTEADILGVTLSNLPNVVDKYTGILHDDFLESGSTTGEITKTVTSNGELYICVGSEGYSFGLTSLTWTPSPLTLKLDPESVSVDVDNSTTIKPVFSADKDDNDKAFSVTYSVSDENGVSVAKDDDGYATVTGKAVGTYIVTATLDGTYTVGGESVSGLTATATVTVTKKVENETLTITIDPTYLSFVQGTTATKTAKIVYTDKDGNEITNISDYISVDEFTITTESNENCVAVIKDLNTLEVTTKDKAGVSVRTFTIKFNGNTHYLTTSTEFTALIIEELTLDAETPLNVYAGESNSKSAVFTYELRSDLTDAPALTAEDFTATSSNNDGVFSLGTISVNTETHTITVPVTGLTLGAGNLTLTFKGNDYYATSSKTISVIVEEDNKQYIGANLKAGMHGSLEKDGTTTLYWKFGADTTYTSYHMAYNTVTTKDENGKTIDTSYFYGFSGMDFALEDNAHESKGAIDQYYKTRLTKDGGDAYTEYNGMVGGYGTEWGGRYLTPITGTFIRVEPLYDGVVTLRIRHNGGVDGASIDSEGDTFNVLPEPDGWVLNSDVEKTYKDSDGNEKTRKAGTPINYRFARRPLYVMDENGMIMKRTTNYEVLDDWMDKSYDSTTGYYTTENPTFTSSTYKLDGTWAFISGKQSKVQEAFDFVKKRYLELFDYMKNPSNYDATYSGTDTLQLRRKAIANLVIPNFGKNYDHNYSINAFDFIRNKVYGSEDFDNLQVSYNSSGSWTDGSIQRLWYSDEDANKDTNFSYVSYQANVRGYKYDNTDYTINTKDYTTNSQISETNFFAPYGYEVLSATHLKLSFPVKAGRTYFVAANKSKIGLCTIEFQSTGTTVTNNDKTTYEVDPAMTSTVTSSNDTEISATANNDLESQYPGYFVLDENVESTPDWLMNPGNYNLAVITDYREGEQEEGKNLNQHKYSVGGSVINVLVKRTFTPGYWHPIVLPFSVSETQMQETFGKNVQVIYLDGKLKMRSSVNNYTTRDEDTYDEGTSSDRTYDKWAWTYQDIKNPAIHNGTLEFTKHYYQMLYANCPAFVYIDPSDWSSAKDHVTFERVVYSRPYFNSDGSLLLPFAVDRSIGDGYEMVAKYCKTAEISINTDMYYLSNVDGEAVIYHAQAGKNPEMKGMRVWIQPKSTGSTGTTSSAPLRQVGFYNYHGEELEQAGAASAGITDIVMDDIKVELYNDGNVYDMMGRVVGHRSTEGLPHGVYILNGRKILK